MVWFQELGPDLLHHILENLESVGELRSIGNTNKYLHHFIFHSDLADKLFQRHLPSSRPGEENIGGRQYWQNIYKLRLSILRNGNTRHRRRVLVPVGGDAPVSLSPLPTLGILTEQEESQTFIYDNPLPQPPQPAELPSGQRSSVGYFGFQPLVNGTVAVWGDFDGLAVVPSLDAILAPPPPPPQEDQDDRSPANLIYTESQQVMTILQHGNFLFLGTAAGTVHSLRILDLDQDSGDDNNDKCQNVSSCTRHITEVTSLVAANYHIVSAAVNGDVLLHRNALKNGKVDTVARILNLRRSIFCMACTSIGRDSILCLGAQPASSTLFVIWNSTRWRVTPDNEMLRDFQLMCSHERRRGHSTRIEFLGNKNTSTPQRLVEGNNFGDVSVSDTFHSVVKPSPTTTTTTCSVERRYTLTRCCRGGCVESIELVGTLLITAGGSDGVVRTFDWDTGASIGSIQIHPGRPMSSLPSPANLKVAVVSTYMCHERSSLLCLCRDGHLRQWSFLNEQQGQQESSSKKKRARISVSQPTRRSSRISARHG
jgi:hypothetical protein